MINQNEYIANCITSKKPLTGKALEAAIDVVLENREGFSDKKFLDNLAKKLISGLPLDDYEIHIMVDVLLLHSKLDTN